MSPNFSISLLRDNLTVLEVAAHAQDPNASGRGHAAWELPTRAYWVAKQVVFKLAVGVLERLATSPYIGRKWQLVEAWHMRPIAKLVRMQLCGLSRRRLR